MRNRSPRGLCVPLNRVKPYVAMVSVQLGYAGLNIVCMLCLKRGLSHYVLVIYRHAVATLVISPFALVFEGRTRPKMTISTFLKIMALGLLEPVIDQNLYYVGMNYTSATFAAAIENVLPAITFIMAILFRLERLKIKKLHSQAKIVGTLLSLSGAMIMTLYKGPIVDLVWSRRRSQYGTSSGVTNQHWFRGTSMLLAACFGWAGFFILQSFTLKAYPAELSLTSLICLMGMLEGTVVALVRERDFNAWSLGWDSRLLAPIYTKMKISDSGSSTTGVVCSGITYYVQGVVIRERGPVFVTAFNPLCMIIVAALGSLILAEQIHLGSIIRANIIVVGLYFVVWGTSKDIVTTLPLTSEKRQVSELSDNGTKAIIGNSKRGGEIMMPEIPT